MLEIKFGETKEPARGLLQVEHQSWPGVPRNICPKKFKMMPQPGKLLQTFLDQRQRTSDPSDLLRTLVVLRLVDQVIMEEFPLEHWRRTYTTSATTQAHSGRIQRYP